jgi:tripartite ATP-independent transporter DctP family solute receptor
MKKITQCKTILFQCAVFAFLLLMMSPKNAACAASQETSNGSGKIEMQWYQPEPIGHPWTDVAMLMASAIGEKSSGGLVVTVYPAGSLGTQPEGIDMMRNGTLALMNSNPGNMASFYEAIQVSLLPYIFDDPEHGYRFFDSAYGQKLYNDILLKKSGVRTLAFWYFGNRHLTTKGIKINTPADLNGKKIRSINTPVSISVVTALGGSPVPIDFTELYLALQTGVVQGQENPIPTIVAQKFEEVQDNIILTGHSVHMGTVHASEAIWSKLTPDQQKIINDVLIAYRREIDKRINDQTEKGIRSLKAKGVAVYEPDIAAFRKNAEIVLDKSFGSKPEWKEAIEAVRALRNK